MKRDIFSALKAIANNANGSNADYSSIYTAIDAIAVSVGLAKTTYFHPYYRLREIAAAYGCDMSINYGGMYELVISIAKAAGVDVTSVDSVGSALDRIAEGGSGPVPPGPTPGPVPTIDPRDNNVFFIKPENPEDWAAVYFNTDNYENIYTCHQYADNSISSWEPYVAGSQVGIEVGEKLYVLANKKNVSEALDMNFMNVPDFGSKVCIGNDPKSLVYGEGFVGLGGIDENAFNYMFANNPCISDASALEVYIGNRSVAFAMFANCPNLVNGPMITSFESMDNMWRAAAYMFEDCGSLNNLTLRIDTEWSTAAFENWLSGVAANGVIHQLGVGTIPTDTTSGCPSGWTVDYPTPM